MIDRGEEARTAQKVEELLDRMTLEAAFGRSFFAVSGCLRVVLKKHRAARKGGPFGREGLFHFQPQGFDFEGVEME